MKRPRDTLTTLALVALVLTGPSALAAWVFTRDAPAPDLIPAALTRSAPASDAARAAPAPAPLLSGVLYTRGTATVDWNGVQIPVKDGSYAYLGGETVTTAANSIGLLELADGNRVYVCPGSRMSLERAPAGAYRLSVSEGTSRYVFDARTGFQVRANQGLVTPRPSAGDGSVVGEIAVFRDHPGGVVCSFGNAVDVAGFAPGAPHTPVALGSAGPGEIVDLARALRDERAGSGTPVTMRPIPMPREVNDWLTRNAGPSGSGAYIGYLCRCEELKRYAEAEGIPSTAIAPRLEPPQTGEPALLDPAPVLYPPAAPPLAQALPGVPDAADPGVLPSPATGPDDPVLTVPPPAVPVGGSGGGTTATAS